MTLVGRKPVVGAAYFQHVCQPLFDLDLDTFTERRRDLRTERGWNLCNELIVEPDSLVANDSIDLGAQRPDRLIISLALISIFGSRKSEAGDLNTSEPIIRIGFEKNV